MRLTRRVGGGGLIGYTIKTLAGHVVERVPPRPTVTAGQQRTDRRALLYALAYPPRRTLSSMAEVYPASTRHPPLLARPPACSVTAPRLRASNKRVLLGVAREKRSP